MARARIHQGVRRGLCNKMATTFFYSLAGGMLAVVATGRVEQIAWWFLRLIVLIAFAIACGVTIWALRRGGLESATAGVWATRMGVAVALAAMAAVFMAPFATRMVWAFRFVCGLGGLLGLSAACISLTARVGNAGELPLVATTVIIIGQVLGAMILGSVTIAWVLGHAYLTASKMTIAPLRHFSRMLSWAVTTRIAFLVLSLGAAWIVGHDARPPVLGQLGGAWLIVFLRVGVGLVGVGALAYMVLDCVRRRATQSATGILYFGSIFAYIGEFANQQLITECGWAL